MAHVHVCLVSGQPIPNLTTVVQLMPERVALLVTTDMADRAAWLRGAIRARGVEVEEKPVGPYDMNSVITACEEIQQAHPQDSLSLNITGGTKISTLGAFQSFYTTKWPIYYVNTQDHSIMQINSAATGTEAPIRISIPLAEYLAVHGFAISHYQPDEEGPRGRQALTQTFVDAACSEVTSNAIREINAKAPNPFARQYNPWMEMPGQHYGREIIKKARELGMVGRARDRRIEIPKAEDAFYLKGGWLEEYVFLTAKTLGSCEVLRNVKGQWATRRKPPRNEYDVLIGHGNQVFYISCKTSFPGEDEHTGSFRPYLYELDALGDDLLGLFGKKMLASAIAITDVAIRDRAERLRVTLVDGQRLRGLDRRLREWVGDARRKT
jgi:hypothetical protein